MGQLMEGNCPSSTISGEMAVGELEQDDVTRATRFVGTAVRNALKELM